MCIYRLLRQTLCRYLCQTIILLICNLLWKAQQHTLPFESSILIISFLTGLSVMLITFFESSALLMSFPTGAEWLMATSGTETIIHNTKLCIVLMYAVLYLYAVGCSLLYWSRWWCGNWCIVWHNHTVIIHLQIECVPPQMNTLCGIARKSCYDIHICAFNGLDTYYITENTSHYLKHLLFSVNFIASTLMIHFKIGYS